MEKHISLSLLNPCSEQWGSFSATTTGGFCATCRKNVVDFTAMSDEAIAAYFAAPRAKVCGRFRSSQLKSYAHLATPALRPGLKLFGAGIIALMLLVWPDNASAQSLAQADGMQAQVVQTRSTSMQGLHVILNEFTLEGVVQDETGQPMPGVNVYLKADLNTGTVTDVSGKFTFPRKVKGGEIIVFSFIGYVPKEYAVMEAAGPAITINMTLDQYIVLGEVSVNEVYGTKTSGVKRLMKKLTDLF